MRLIFICMFFFISSKLESQLYEDNSKVERQSDTSKFFKSAKKYHLAYTSSALLNTSMGFQVKHIYQASKRINLESETGVIFYSTYENRKNTYGFRMKPTINFKLINGKSSSFCFSAFYNFRYTNSYAERTIQRANGKYSEFIKGNHEILLSGPGLSIGGIIDSDEKHPWFINFGLGKGNLENIYSHPELVRRGDFFLDFSGVGKQEFFIIFLNLSHQIF